MTRVAYLRSGSTGLIDGNGGPPLRDAALVVAGGRIASVGSRTDVVVPEGAEVIEAPGHTLMPGLVDVHVHLAYSGIPHKRAFRAEGTDMSYPSDGAAGPPATPVTRCGPASPRCATLTLLVGSLSTCVTP